MRALLCLLLLGCGGRVLGDPVLCVTDAATMSCDGGEVLLYAQDGSSGTLTTCHVCTLGSLCTFQSGGTFVDGVCR